MALKHEVFMRLAIRRARLAKKQGLPPIGAVLVKGNVVIAQTFNQKDRLKDPTAHAEVLAIRKAACRYGPNLDGCRLFVTLKPCLMCLAAAYWAHVEEIHYGADENVGLQYFVTRKDLYPLVLKQLVLRRIRVTQSVLKDECENLFL